MLDLKARQSLDNLGAALLRLEEALAEPAKNSLLIDGTIQRFEFVIELFWKTLKRLLILEGVETGTPREALQMAYQVHWIDDEAIWVQMMKDRNETSHTYNEISAIRIYQHIQEYFPILKDRYDFLKDRFQ